MFTVINVGGVVSGGCFNPAVGIVQVPFQNIIAGTYNSGVVDYSHYFIYPIAPALGGFLAGILCLMNMKSRENQNGEDQKSIIYEKVLRNMVNPSSESKSTVDAK